MGYWIYNMGLPTRISFDSLMDNGAVKPLSALVKSDALSDSEQDKSKSRVDERRQGRNAYQQSEQQRKPISNAGQLMSTKVVTLQQALPIKKAWQVFAKYGYRHFPVVDNHQHLVGILSDRDILTRAATAGIAGLTVANLMKNPVLTAEASTTIREICEILFQHHIGALPITNDQGALLGMVTRSDILRAMIQHGPLELWA